MDEGLEVIAKNWRDLRRRLELILKEILSERKKEAEQTVCLDGIESLINLQNDSNMTTLIESLKESLPTKTEGKVSEDVGSARTTKIMKPA